MKSANIYDADLDWNNVEKIIDSNVVSLSF